VKQLFIFEAARVILPPDIFLENLTFPADVFSGGLHYYLNIGSK